MDIALQPPFSLILFGVLIVLVLLLIWQMVGATHAKTEAQRLTQELEALRHQFQVQDENYRELLSGRDELLASDEQMKQELASSMDKLAGLRNEMREKTAELTRLLENRTEENQSLQAKLSSLIVENEKVVEEKEILLRKQAQEAIAERSRVCAEITEFVARLETGEEDEKISKLSEISSSSN